MVHARDKRDSRNHGLWDPYFNVDCWAPISASGGDLLGLSQSDSIEVGASAPGSAIALQ